MLGCFPFGRTGRPQRNGQGRSARSLTRSLRGIHARADVNKKADLATKLSNIPPTFLCGFLPPEEEEDNLYIFFQLFVFIPGAN